MYVWTTRYGILPSFVVSSLRLNFFCWDELGLQMLQVLYGTGNASIPGLFFPKGANGRFATTLLAAGLTSQPLLH